MPPDFEEGRKVWCREVAEVAVVGGVVVANVVWPGGWRRQLLCWWLCGRAALE